MIINLEVLDFKQILILYRKIEDLFNDFNLKFSIIIEKIKRLKKDLVKSVLENEISLGKMFETVQYG